MIRQCRKPHCGGQILPDDEVDACTLCGTQTDDRSRSLAERLIPAAVLARSYEVQGRPPAALDMAAIRARVLDRVKREAGRAHP